MLSINRLLIYICEASSARQESTIKRSFYAINEHIKLIFNAAMATVKQPVNPFQAFSAWRWVPIAFALFLAACTSSIHVPFDKHKMAVNTAKAPSVKRDTFAYPKQAISSTNHDLPNDINGYQLKQVHVKAQHDSGPTKNDISFRYFKHDSAQPKPLVIVIPIYGSHTYPSEKITASLLKMHPTSNIALLEYEQRLFDFEGLVETQTEDDVIRIVDDTRDKIIAGVVDIRRVIDWAEQQQDIDTEQIAVVSFSMSALVGSLLAQHEPRIRASVVVMAAAQFHEVLAICPGRPGRGREAVLAQLNWSVDQYKQVWAKHGVDVDPSSYFGLADPARILMIDAHYDECMPQSTRDVLWQSLGQPERISYRYSHKKAFYAMTPLGFNVMRRRISQFVQAQLSSSTAWNIGLQQPNQSTSGFSDLADASPQSSVPNRTIQQGPSSNNCTQPNQHVSILPTAGAVESPLNKCIEAKQGESQQAVQGLSQ